MLRDSNQPDFSETSIEILGAEGSYGPHSRARGAREVILKLAAKHETTQALNMLVRESTSAATAMSPGICGMAGNRPKVSPVVRLFSCLVPKAELPVAVHVEGNILPVDVPLEGGFDAAMLRESSEQAEAADVGGDDASGMVTVPLVALAYGRSGDKGNHANVGIIARRPDYLPWIRRTLTEQAVASHYAHILEGAVHRFDLPGVHGLNFLLENVLGGGGTASLRNDPQGKAFAQMLLDYPVSVPRALAVADKLEVLAA
jgi:hypothetical protein